MTGVSANSGLWVVKTSLLSFHTFSSSEKVKQLSIVLRLLVISRRAVDETDCTPATRLRDSEVKFLIMASVEVTSRAEAMCHYYYGAGLLLTFSCQAFFELLIVAPNEVVPPTCRVFIFHIVSTRLSIS